ncbi:hypothetical protein diail_8744 [Diaporthe ilicicola]|nr:hypothetical protein diail_8744 [Diaporthe ilicicola]
MSDGDNADPTADRDGEIEVFDVAMFESGSEGSGFHTKNNPKDPYQRQEVIQRAGAIDIRCSVIDVAHGVMDPDSECWATLMVLQFRFDPQKRMRRITEASLELSFDVIDPANEIPEVEAISFDEITAFSQASRTSPPLLGVKDSWSHPDSHHKWHGQWREVCHNNMPPNRIAKWTLLENATLKSGIPASLQVAVRIKRQDEEIFSCMPKIKCRADKWTSIESFFGKVPEDDPVLLCPDRKPTNRLMVYDKDNIGAINLQALGNIVPTTMIRDAEQEKENAK